MQFALRRFAFLAVFLLVIPCLQTGFAAEPAPPVAQVGSLKITVPELNRAVQKIMPLNVSFHGGVSKEKIAEIRKKALDGLVEQGLKIQYALANQLVVDNAKVEARFQKIRDRFKTEAEFQKALNGLDPAELKADFYRELLAAKAEEVAVNSKVKISEAAISDYYQQNKERFKRPRQYRASHILVKVDPASNKEERAALLKKAESLLARAKAGEDFYNLAYYNSDDRTRYVGGDLGVFHQGQTVKPFEQALEKMKPGDIAGPVKTMYGYHIIKLVSVDEARQLTFEEMHDKIKQMLEEKARTKLRSEWLKGLRDAYPVKYF